MGTLCLLVVSVYLSFVSPAIDFYQQRQTALTEKRMLLVRLKAVAAGVPMLRTRLAALQSAASAQQVTLDGANDAIAAANLQNRLEKLAAAAGVTVASTEALPAENREGFRRVGLRLAINGDYGAIVRLLATIEEAVPPLISSNLHLRGTNRSADKSAERFDGGLEVYGFREVGASVVTQR